MAICFLGRRHSALHNGRSQLAEGHLWPGLGGGHENWGVEGADAEWYGVYRKGCPLPNRLGGLAAGLGQSPGLKRIFDIFLSHRTLLTDRKMRIFVQCNVQNWHYLYENDVAKKSAWQSGECLKENWEMGSTPLFSKKTGQWQSNFAGRHGPLAPLATPSSAHQTFVVISYIS